MYCTSGKFCTKPACDDDNDDESCSFRLVATLFQKLYVHCSESYDGEEQSVHVVSEFRPALPNLQAYSLPMETAITCGNYVSFPERLFVK